MNLDEDFVDYTGYDSPDYYDYSDEGVESDSSDEDSADGETQEEPGDNQRSKRKTGSELLGDIEGEWVDGKRTGSKVICRGALYTISKPSASGEFLFARCDQRKGCQSRLWIRADNRQLHLISGEHNHVATPWLPVNARVKQNQMQLVETDTNLAPGEVVKRTTEELEPVDKQFLPRKDVMARAVETRKRKLLGLPRAPTDFHFDVPDALKTFSNGDRFLLYDSGKEDPKRILIFGDTSMRATLGSVQTISGDGTFKRCPLQHKCTTHTHISTSRGSEGNKFTAVRLTWRETGRSTSRRFAGRMPKGLDQDFVRPSGGRGW